MRHIVLLGDSIFDNAAYVRGGPDVVAQLRAICPTDVRATLLAVDGAVAASVPAQLGRLPQDATDLVLSVGGNDALRHVGLLERGARSGAEALSWFAAAVEEFAPVYRALLARLRTVGRPVTVCTIYDGNLEPVLAPAARAALGIFNDTIQRAAREARMPVIELRDVCAGPADYANAIEPSLRGGAKIAQAVLDAVLGARERV